MKTSPASLIAASGLFTTAITLGSFAVIAPAMAQSTSTVSANVSLTTDYRFRGISQNNLKPAIQGGFDLEFGQAYVGTWASNVGWLADGGGGAVSSSVEMDLYGGYKGESGSISYDVGGLYYYYPGTYPSGFNSPDTLEIYGGIGWQGLGLKVSYAATDLFGFDESDGSTYIDLSYETELAGYTVGAHVGNQQIPSTDGRSSSECSYTDWSVSGARSFGGFDFTLAYVDTNAKDCYTNAFNKDLGKGTVTLSVGKSF